MIYQIQNLLDFHISDYTIISDDIHQYKYLKKKKKMKKRN